MRAISSPAAIGHDWSSACPKENKIPEEWIPENADPDTSDASVIQGRLGYSGKYLYHYRSTKLFHMQRILGILSLIRNFLSIIILSFSSFIIIMIIPAVNFSQQTDIYGRPLEENQL